MGAALARAGFRRYSTYRQATLAGLTTNVVFGLLRTSILTATAAGAGGTAAGYSLPQLVAYVWIGQGLIATVGAWGWNELSDRIRTGNVVSDLLRPVNPIWTYLATDVGRAAYNLLGWMLVPFAIGAVFFPFYWPQRPATYALLAASIAAAVTVTFACNYLVNLTAYWLLDTRGVTSLWVLASAAASGLYFPIAFLPHWLGLALQFGTPFPSLFQFPTDIWVERGGLPGQLARLGGQLAWAAVMLVIAQYVQGRAMRRLVIQGG